MTDYDPKEFQKKPTTPKWVIFIGSWVKAFLSILVFVAFVLFLIFAIKWLWLRVF